MLDRIDVRLLSFAGVLVKRFNWLTGKDNFFLARKLKKASFFIWPLFAVGVVMLVATRATTLIVFQQALIWALFSVLFLVSRHDAFYRLRRTAKVGGCRTGRKIFGW